jgi:phage N-6-adenine-methyltransferase
MMRTITGNLADFKNDISPAEDATEILPGAIANLPAIETAPLLANYERAKTALANCEAIDECKDWADKMQALASYARQAHYDELLHMALRIQARALRRAGELLRQIGEDKGGRPKNLDGGVPVLTRTEAAKKAGLSERQRKNALKLAAKDEAEFNDLVESSFPPTITELVEGKPWTCHTSNTGDVNWHTPPKYLEGARAVLGGFDLDPASCDGAQETVKASQYFTKEQDGLSQPWHGRVWLNPPFAQGEIARFVSKLIDEFVSGNVTAAIFLCHNYTDTTWFHEAVAACRAICFTAGRINFIHAERGLALGSASRGQAFLYFGDDIDAFRREFEPQIGFVLEPGRSFERHPLFYIHEAYALIGKSPLPAELARHTAEIYGRTVTIQHERGVRQDQALALAVAEFVKETDDATHQVPSSPELVTKWPPPQPEPVPAKLAMKERRAKLDKAKAAEDRRIAKTRLANGRKHQAGRVP